MIPVIITVYKYTGRHLGGLLKIGEDKCAECEMNVGAALAVQQELGDDKVQVDIKSYFSNIHRALLKGVFHPPATLVNGRYIYGGEDFPDPGLLKEEVLKELRSFSAVEIPANMDATNESSN